MPARQKFRSDTGQERDSPHRTSHEEHFGEVARRFFSFVEQPGTLPAWEKPNMLAKYWLTTGGTELSRQSPPRALERRAPQ